MHTDICQENKPAESLYVSIYSSSKETNQSTQRNQPKRNQPKRNQPTNSKQHKQTNKPPKLYY